MGRAMSIAEKVFEKLKAAPPEMAREVLDFVEFLEAKAQAKAQKQQSGQASSWDQFMGCLKDSKVFEGDPVEIQRKLRAEWDREWDK